MSVNVKIQASDLLVLVAHHAQSIQGSVASIMANPNGTESAETLFVKIRRMNEVAESLLQFIAGESVRSESASSVPPLDEDHLENGAGV